MIKTLKLAIPVCLIGVYIVWITGTTGTSIPNLTESCFRCLCYVATKCDVSLECKAGYCGPFHISRVYWADAGEVVMPEDDPEGSHGVPIEKSSQEDINGFYDDLAKAHESISTNFIISLGDFNAQIGIAKKHKHSVTGKHGYGKGNPRAWENCARDYQCSKRIIESYIKRFGKDCNGDGEITCFDYMMVNANGGYACSAPLNRSSTGRQWLQRFEECRL